MTKYLTDKPFIEIIFDPDADFNVSPIDVDGVFMAHKARSEWYTQDDWGDLNLCCDWGSDVGHLDGKVVPAYCFALERPHRGPGYPSHENIFTMYVVSDDEKEIREAIEIMRKFMEDQRCKYD